MTTKILDLKRCEHLHENSSKMSYIDKTGVTMATLEEMPDGEGPFLPNITDKLTTKGQDKISTVDRTPRKGRKISRGNKHGRTGELHMHKKNSNDIIISSEMTKKGRKKSNTKASKTKVNKSETIEENKKSTNVRCEEKNVEKGMTNIQLLRRSSGTKSTSVLMHFIVHNILDLQMDRTFHSKNTTPILSARCGSDFEDHSGYIDLYNNNNNNNNKRDDQLVDMDSSILNNRRKKLEKKIARRYSVLPFSVCTREETRENLKQGTPLKTSLASLPRSSSVPSVNICSYVPSTPTSKEEEEENNGNNNKSVQQITQSSIDDNFDILKTGDMLCLKRQLLTRSLVSLEEKKFTATIVFDLDETLCNNRGEGPAILRPGAIEMLKQLRAMYPHPVIHMENSSSHIPKMGTNTHSNRTSTRTTGAGLMLDNNSLEGTTTTTTVGGDGDGDGVIVRLELIIWTASVELVARPVIARLDPDGSILDEVIYRDVRWYSEGSCIKDLRRIGRHMERSIIVENAPSSVAMNRRNAILVNDFVNNPNDRQLFIVHAILQEWLSNLNTLLLHRHLYEHVEKRQCGVQDGGESPEPDLNIHSVSTHMDSTHSFSGGGRGRNMLMSLSSSREFLLQEMERNASVIHFLTRHPFLSPGTRYVKPSVWKKAMKFLHQNVITTPTTTTSPTTKTKTTTVMTGGVTGGTKISTKKKPVDEKVEGVVVPLGIKCNITTTPRPVVIANPRRRCTFPELTSGSCEK